MSAGSEALMTATVQVAADMATLDAALAELPAKTVARIKEAETKIQAEIAKNRAAMNALGPTTSPMTQEMARLEAQATLLAQKLSAVGTAAQGAVRSVVTSSNGIGGAANQAAYKLQVMGQGLDDLQYVGEQGLRPILNNLMQISPLLGITAIAVDQVAKAFGGWAAIAEQVGRVFGSSHMKTETERMAELEKQVIKTANEYRVYLGLKERASTGESLREGHSESEKTQKDRVEKAVAEADHDKLVKGLIETNEINLVGRSPEARNAKEKMDKANADAARLHATPEATARFNNAAVQARHDYKAAVAKSATDFLADAALDPGALSGLIGLAKANPGSFPKDFAKSLENASPEAIAQQKAAKDMEAANKAWDEADKAEIDARKKEKDARQKQTDDIGKWQDENEKDAKRGAERGLDEKKDQQTAMHRKIEDMELKKRESEKHKSAVMDIDPFFKSLQTSVKSPEDKQIEELKKQSKALDRIVENTAKQIKATYN